MCILCTFARWQNDFVLLRLATNAAISCKILVNMGLVVSEYSLTNWTCARFTVVVRLQITKQWSQDKLDWFLQSLHQMKALWVQMIDLDLFFWYLKGRCHGNQFCEKMALSQFSRAGILNGLQYCNFDFRILNRMKISILCTILVTVGSVTPEIVRVTTAPFWTRRQKSAY